MNSMIGSLEMLCKIVDLGMTVMAGGHTIISSRCYNLIKFHFAVLPACFGVSGLQITTATAATA